MSDILWTDPAPADADRLSPEIWEQLKKDITDVINGGIDAANLRNGIITRDKLATGNKDSVRACSFTIASEVVSTTRVGVDVDAAGQEYYLTTDHEGGTLTAWDVAVDGIAANTLECIPFVAGAQPSGVTQQDTTGTGQQIVGETGLSVAVAAGARLGMFLSSNTTTTKAYNIVVTLWIETNLT